MSGIIGLHHVQVAAPPGCEEAARSFYGGLLGLDEVEKPAALAARGGCWFRTGATALHIGVADSFAPAEKAHPALHVGSFDELRRLADTLSAAGSEVAWADDSEIPGLRRFHVEDPWGNRVELVAAR